MARKRVPLSQEEIARRQEQKAASNARYYAKNRSKILEGKKDYYIENREDILEQKKDYHLRNLAHRLAYGKEYYAKNSERICVVVSAYTAAHKDEKRAYNHAYSVAHQEELSQQNKAYRLAHLEEISAAQREWRQSHPENLSAATARRKARKAAVPVNDFTPAQWRGLCKAVGYRCCYCGKQFPSTQLTPDHLTPYVEQGSNTLHNVLPCCGSCNSRKKDRAVLKPVQPFLLLPEDAAD